MGVADSLHLQPLLSPNKAIHAGHFKFQESCCTLVKMTEREEISLKLKIATME